MDSNQASILHLLLSAFLSAVVGYIAFKYKNESNKADSDRKEKEDELWTTLREHKEAIKANEQRMHQMDLALTDKTSRLDLEKTTDMLFKAVADLRTELKADIQASTETILNFIGKGGGQHGSI